MLNSYFFLGVIDYNFLIFREGITQVFELRSKQKLEAEMEDLNEEVYGGFSSSVMTNGSHIS